MKFELEPIGVVHTDRRYRYEAPRQGVFTGSPAEIELLPDRGFELALRELAGVERIWVIFGFHLNQHWHPLVTPPVAPPGRRIGVFATRSPHRPNRLGLSAVELLEVTGLTLKLGACDLLDGTPVFDLKPYVPAADAFPDSRVGWLEEAVAERYQVEFTPEFRERAELIRTASRLDLENFARVQLAFNPLDRSRKRLTPPSEPGGCWQIGCRTWQLAFTVAAELRRIRVSAVFSRYTAEELAPGAPDPYADKELHRLFRRRFG